MSDTGWLTGANVTNSGSGVEWGNRAALAAEDDDWATCELHQDDVSADLMVTGFDANVPIDATVDGIEFRIIASRTNDGGEVKDQQVVLEGASSGDRSLYVDWVDSDQERIYGGPTDQWDVDGGLDPSTVNDSPFGISIRVVERSVGNTAAMIDIVQMKVYYTDSIIVAENDQSAFFGFF